MTVVVIEALLKKGQVYTSNWLELNWLLKRGWMFRLIDLIPNSCTQLRPNYDEEEEEEEKFKEQLQQWKKTEEVL